MAVTYLQINFKDGKLFEFSSNKKEGFEENFNKEGVQKGYRKYYSFITGEFISLKERENKKMNNRKELNVYFKVDEEIYVVVFNVYSQNKSFDSFTESFISHLPFLIKGETYTLRCFNFENEKGNKVIGTSISKGGEKGEKLEKIRQRFKKKDGTVTEGEIPEFHWEKKRGDWFLNNDEQQDYLFTVYTKGLDDFEGEVSISNTGIKPSSSFEREESDKTISASQEQVQPTYEEEDEDGLPF